MANIEYVRSHNEAIELLTRLKMIVSYKYRNGYLVARYGVNKKTLAKVARVMDGEK